MKITDRVTSCACVGPKNGEPLCPCMMRGVRQRNGRWIRPEQDLGPVRDADSLKHLRESFLTWDDRL